MLFDSRASKFADPTVCRLSRAQHWPLPLQLFASMCPDRTRPFLNEEAFSLIETDASFWMIEDCTCAHLFCVSGAGTSPIGFTHTHHAVRRFCHCELLELWEGPGRPLAPLSGRRAPHPVAEGSQGRGLGGSSQRPRAVAPLLRAGGEQKADAGALSGRGKGIWEGCDKPGPQKGHTNRYSAEPHWRVTHRNSIRAFSPQEEHPGFDFSGASFSGQAPSARTFMGGVHHDPSSVR